MPSEEQMLSEEQIARSYRILEKYKRTTPQTGVGQPPPRTQTATAFDVAAEAEPISTDMERRSRKILERYMKAKVPKAVEWAADTPPAKLLGKIIDVYSRGEYASANIASLYMFGHKPVGTGDIGMEIYEGLTGKKKNTYDQIVERTFPEWGGLKKFATSLTLSIALDPLTYTGMLGWPKLAGKVIRGAKMGVGATLGRTRAGKMLGKMFIPGHGLPKDYYQMLRQVQRDTSAEQYEFITDIVKLRKGLSTEDMKKMTYYRQHPDQIGELPDKLREKLYDIGKLFDDEIDRAFNAKAITQQQREQWQKRKYTYLPGIYPKSKGFMSQVIKGELPKAGFSPRKPTFLKRKKFETVQDAKDLSDQCADVAKSKTKEEALRKIEQHGLRGSINLDYIGDDIKTMRRWFKSAAKTWKPEENIFKLAAYNKFQSIAWLNQTKFTEEVLEKFGEKIPWNVKIPKPGHGIYYPKGRLNFYVSEHISPSALKNFTKNMKKWADDLKRQAHEVRTEKVTEVKRTVETEVRGAKVGELATEGPMAKMESVIREALQSRGFTKGEADNYIGRMKARGSEAIDEAEIMTTTTEKMETIREVIDSKPGFYIKPEAIPEFMMKKLVGVSRKVPAYMLHEEIAKGMNRLHRFYVHDESTNWIWHKWDRVQSAWKVMATTWRWPFHARNFQSNIWQAYMSGVNNPVRFGQAFDVRLAMQTKRLGSIKLGGKRYSYDEVGRMIDKYGVRGRGWIGSDVQVNALKEVDSILKRGKFRYLNPSKLGRSFGTAVEDNARIAVFLDQIARGASFEDAARQVRKYLFDYQELTDAEKWMRRFIPFYTWSRKNFPLQIDNLIRKPHRYAAHGKIIRAYGQPEDDYEKMFKPKYFGEMAYVKSPFRTKSGKPIYMSLDLPPMEWNRISSWRHALSSITPLAKLPVELVTGQVTFPEVRPMIPETAHKKHVKLPAAIRGIKYLRDEAPAWVAWLPEQTLKALKKAGAIDMYIDQRTQENKLGMDVRVAHAFHNAFPFLNELNRIYAQPIHMDDEAPHMKWRSFLLGVSHSYIDPIRQGEAEKWRLLKAGAKHRSAAKRYLKPPTKKEFLDMGYKEYEAERMGGE